MIKGNGIDIIEIHRIKKALDSEGFINRIFSEEEIDYLSTRSFNNFTIAGMFAAKEAVSKALGSGIRDFSWKDIIILHDELGKPLARLSGNALDIASKSNIKQIHLSISHSKEYALAFAIAED